MREKELRLALVCYGGISLAVYMHGVTKELWRLARASRAFLSGDAPDEGAEAVYHRFLAACSTAGEAKLRVLVDIVAGASAGGINGVFLAQAVATGQSLEPLTRLWLETADVERLLDPDARPLTRFTKFWATPIAWGLAGRRGGTVDQTVEPAAREEVRAKLSALVRGRWFAPPFGGRAFTDLLLDAFDAMARAPCGPPLLPDGHPLDLIVTVTDFHGHPERLRLHSPPEVVETEHRLLISFSDRSSGVRRLADPADLAFAARATASFPGAFPPFGVRELDEALDARAAAWPGREDFLARVLPRHHAAGQVEAALLIDGSVLANAPFRPAIDALGARPARHEIDRRFVYIDPTPSRLGFRLGGAGGDQPPGFFATILGALTNLPREQPIRDNLEAIERRSARIRRMAALVESIRPEVEEAVERLFGQPLFFDRPTPARLAAWRRRANETALKGAGYAQAAYAQLKLAGIADEAVALVHALAPRQDGGSGDRLAEALRDAVARAASGGEADAALFLRKHDLAFRIRRLRFLCRRAAELAARGTAPEPALEALREAIYAGLAPYLGRPGTEGVETGALAAALLAAADGEAVLDWLETLRDLRAADDRADALLAEAFAALPKPERRAMLLAYLGFPFYDIATLPLLGGEHLDEFDPIKVDRISPDDCGSIREGGAEATLKGIQFNGFGAFFSRAYRENDYLWGRLHGAERLLDILASALPPGRSLPPGALASAKREAFRAILKEERPRLTAIPELFDVLEAEVG